MFETLETSVEDTIGRITLNRPQRLNALSLQLLNELAEAAEWFNQQQSVRAVIVTGNGRAFSAGADLEGFPQPGEASARKAADAGRVMADAIEAMNAITIAGVHGWCVGGGLVVAAACDLRIAAEDARFSIPEVDLGIPLAWGGIPRLVREIGPALTKELVITCREFSASEAVNAGFLNRMVAASELEKAVEDLAVTVASKPRGPALATKRHTNAVTEQSVGTMRSWADADGLLASLMDPECMTARAAYLEARLGKR
ncbi:MAG: enoyl-CoA hydratase/isomerase family protein [Pseudomonadales bacterium]